MDIVLYALSAFFLVVFGIRFVWFVIDYIGKLFWNVSGIMICWTFGILLVFMFYKSGVIV
jgi:hypothetical protein